MKRFVLTLSLLSVSFSGSLLAQDPAKRDFLPPAPPPAIEPEEAPPAEPSRYERDDQQESISPELWLYLHEEKRFDNPQQAVRRKAEQRAAARTARLTAMKWYGYSNSRPMASASPWMSTYSPFWSGNSWDPYQHIGVGGWPQTAVRIEHYEIIRR